MKKKLKLNDLKVQSFVTSVNAEQVKGGAETLLCLTGVYPTFPIAACLATETNGMNCPTDQPVCDNIAISGVIC